MSLAGIQPVVAATAGGGSGDGRTLAVLLAAGRKSQLFFAPLLAEMRKLPFGRKFASAGRTEEIFGEQLDLRIADSVAANCGGLTRQLIERLQGNDGGQGSPQGGSVAAGSSQADSRPAAGHKAGETTMVHT